MNAQRSAARARSVTLYVVASLAALACSALAGFDDLHGGCPAGLARGSAASAGLPTCIPRADAGAGGAHGGSAGSGGRGAGGGAGLPDAGPGGAGGKDGGETLPDGASGAGAAAAADARARACSRTLPRGAPMAPVRRADGSAFLVDRTEVTFGEYAEFLRAAPPPSQNPLCPPRDAGASRPPECDALVAAQDAGEGPRLPRVCVDWCDADAYCKWAGKELCPDTTRSLPPAELAANSDFYAACTSGGADYGCGAGCNATDCNGQDLGNRRTVPVGATVACVVGDPGCAVSDLSGNVAEWTAGCLLSTPDGSCAVRGGSYDSSEVELRCTSLNLIPRRTLSVTVGFRCCIDPWDG